MGAEVEADGRQRSGAGSAIGGICAATKPRDAEVGATTSNKTKLAVINTDFAFFQITVLITYFSSRYLCDITLICAIFPGLSDLAKIQRFKFFV